MLGQAMAGLGYARGLPRMQSMRILVANDDGYLAPGIEALAEFFGARYGRAQKAVQRETVCARRRELRLDGGGRRSRRRAGDLG